MRSITARSNATQEMLDGPVGSESASHTLTTIREACEELRVSRWTLNRLMQSGEIASLKIGSRRYISRAAIGVFVKGRENKEGWEQ